MLTGIYCYTSNLYCNSNAFNKELTKFYYRAVVNDPQCSPIPRYSVNIVEVNVFPVINFSLTADQTSICDGETVFLTMMGIKGSGCKLEWYRDNIFVNTNQGFRTPILTSTNCPFTIYTYTAKICDGICNPQKA